MKVLAATSASQLSPTQQYNIERIDRLAATLMVMMALLLVGGIMIWHRRGGTDTASTRRSERWIIVLVALTVMGVIVLALAVLQLVDVQAITALLGGVIGGGLAALTGSLGARQSNETVSSVPHDRAG